MAQDPHKEQAPEAEAMGALLEKATLERYKAGEHVIEEGTRPKTLFNLAKGRVTVEIQRLNEVRVRVRVRVQVRVRVSPNLSPNPQPQPHPNPNPRRRSCPRVSRS